MSTRRPGSGLVVGLTGATGHIGGVLLRRLLDDPEISHVRSVARRPLASGPGTGPGAARLIHTTADLREPSARRALEGVDLLFHLAAQVWQGRSAGSLEAMYSANVDGTRNVMLARPAAAVFASSAAVYGAWPDNPVPIVEAREPRPNVECPYALQKLVAERTGLTEVPRHVIARLTAVLGPHADARVAKAVLGYRIAVPAVTGAAQAVQWLDENDAADGLVAAGRALVNGAGIAGQVVNLAPSDWLRRGTWPPWLTAGWPHCRAALSSGGRRWAGGSDFRRSGLTGPCSSPGLSLCPATRRLSYSAGGPPKHRPRS